MKIEDLEKALQYFVIAVPESEEQAKAYFWARKALAVLRSMPEVGEPLSLEQLKQMDGKPVWCEDVERWAIVSVSDAGKWKDVPFALFEKNGGRFEWNVEDRELSLYSYPPAHIDRSEWTAELIYDDCEFNLPKCSACGCRSKDAHYGHKNNFCPKCGRAMTEKAWVELERRLRG